MRRVMGSTLSLSVPVSAGSLVSPVLLASVDWLALSLLLGVDALLPVSPPQAAKDRTMTNASNRAVSFFILVPPNLLHFYPPKRQTALFPNFQILLVDFVPDLRLQFHEPRIIFGGLIAGIGDINVHNSLDAAGTGGHDNDPLCQKDGFIDV